MSGTSVFNQVLYHWKVVKTIGSKARRKPLWAFTPDDRTGGKESDREEMEEHTTEESRFKLSYMWSRNQWRMLSSAEAKVSLSYVRMTLVRLTFSVSSRTVWLFLHGSLYTHLDLLLRQLSPANKGDGKTYRKLYAVCETRCFVAFCFRSCVPGILRQCYFLFSRFHPIFYQLPCIF